MSIIEKLESLSVPRSKESKEREEKRRLLTGMERKDSCSYE